jgi:hypothetical protein
MARTLDDIVEALRRGRDRGVGCTLLIGAGCSKTAGIPLAGGIVDDIRKNPHFDRVYQRALERAKTPKFSCRRTDVWRMHERNRPWRSA